MHSFIQNIRSVVLEAGNKILEVYNNAELFAQINQKEDNSPVTLADIESNKIIEKALTELYDYPIVSEEGENMDYETRKNFNRFWLVDPLDGTKEFIHRNGEFTVNIALIENGLPIWGAIYVPVTQTFYFGMVGKGAFKQVGNGELQSIFARKNNENLIAVGSKSHAKPEETSFFNSVGVSQIVSVGSSIKFCLIAEGNADVYFRSGPTMEWDTAAGQAILAAAGGEVYKDLNAKEVFTYNKPNLLNGSFLAIADTHILK